MSSYFHCICAFARRLVRVSVAVTFFAPCVCLAGYASFSRGTDTISVSGNTILGTQATYEAVIREVSGDVIWNEWQYAAEDKQFQLYSGGGLYGYAYNIGPSLSGGTSVLGAWHHFAYVYDGAQQRLYIDGTLVASQAGSGDIADSPGSTMTVGAIERIPPGYFSFLGDIDSLRISTVARYSGSSFTPTLGDLLPDGSTVLLYNFDEAPGTTVINDLSGNGHTGTLGVGFSGATSPVFVAEPSLVTFTTNTAIPAGNTTYDGQDIVVDGCTVTIDGTHSFASLSIINAGTVTHSAGVAGCDLTVTGDVTVAAGAAISVNGKGSGPASGPGAGAYGQYGGGGAGYGGAGGSGYDGAGGVAYGSLTQPVALGSGGGNRMYNDGGGVGGGAVKLTVTGTLTVDGTIRANGGDGGLWSGYCGGGGSGGSVYLTAASLTGTGTITANGGNGPGTTTGAGGGAGGRIAIYAPDLQFPSGNVTVTGGTGKQSGGAGTIYTSSLGAPNILEIPDTVVTSVPYTVTAHVQVGAGAVTWSLVTGPDGLTIDPNTGVVTWPNPQDAATPYTVTIHAENLAGSDEETWLLTVSAAPETSITSGPEPGSTVCGASADFAWSGTDNTTPTEQLTYAWRLDAGPWSSFSNATSVTLDGLSTGEHTFEVAAQDAGGNVDPTPASRTFTVGLAVPVIAPIENQLIYTGLPYTGPTPQLTQGTAPIEFSLVNPPVDMTINAATGVISWPTPIIDGSPYTITIRASNCMGNDEIDFQLAVEPSVAPVIADIPDASTADSSGYTGPTPTLTQGTPPTTWSLVTWPAGMTINASTGVVSWASPTTEGSPHAITIRATNVAGSDEESWMLTVGTAPVIAAIPDASIEEGVPYTGPTPVLTRGTLPVTWSLVAGPTGMTIDTGTGVVSWPSPTAVGSPHIVTIRATNAYGSGLAVWRLTAAASYTATVSANVSQAAAGTPIQLSGQAISLSTSQPVPRVGVTIRLRVQGTRRVIAVTTNDSGAFVTTFQPLISEAGHYEVGADHPVVATDKTDDEFTLYGMRTDPASVSLTMLTGEQVSGQVQLLNLGDAPIAGITATASPNPAVSVQVTAPESLDASGSAPLSYTVTSTDGAGSGVVQVTIGGGWGTSASLSLFITVKQRVPQLTAAPSPVVSAMLRGEQKFTQFDVTNTGGAATGPLNVAIPSLSWLSLASPATMDSLAPGAKATVVLRLTPAADMPLGRTDGTIAVNGTGVSLIVPFQFTAVSEGIGDLTVIAEDEFTYYAEGEPKLANASVRLSQAADGTPVASGVTDANGSITFEHLPEAYYTVEVTAPDHGTFATTYRVVADSERVLRAFLPRQTVKYTWTVVPTEVEDRYVVVINTVFETYVPAPVITVDPPVVDLSAVGADTQLDFTVTNHGLITANHLKLKFQSTERYEIMPLVDELGDLPAMSSVVVPVRIRDKTLAPSGPAPTTVAIRTAEAKRARLDAKSVKLGADNDPCAVENPLLDLMWDLVCGEVKWSSVSVFFKPPPSEPCPYPDFFPSDYFSTPPIDAGPATWLWDISPRGSQPETPYVAPVKVESKQWCDPCKQDLGISLMKCLLGLIPWKIGPVSVGCVFSTCFAADDCGKCPGQPDPAAAACYANCAASTASAALGCMGRDAESFGICVMQASTAFYMCRTSSPRGGNIAFAQGQADGDPLDEAVAQLGEQGRRMQTYVDYLSELFGDSTWQSVADEQRPLLSTWMGAFEAAFAAGSEDGNLISDSERDQLLSMTLPEPMAASHFIRVIERWNRTVTYWTAGIMNDDDVPPGQSTDFIAFDRGIQKANAMKEAAILSFSEGYRSPGEGLWATYQRVEDELIQGSEGVCARVRIQTEQQAVIARSGFKATLVLDNEGTQSLDNVNVILEIKDAAHTLANDRFGVYPPELTNISDVNGGGSVLPGTSASAQWTMVPNDDAAPTETTSYFVGGALTYTLDGQLVTIPLFPAKIKVLPNPSLHLKYFLEHIVYSDDPFTEEIEPAVPYSLGLIVTNTGAGETHNFRITSAQPQIVDNDKGLLIGFSIIATQVGTQQFAPSLTMNLGDIGPGQSVVGRWLMTSTLEGEFIDYSAEFRHVDALGDPRLSLIDSVDVYETVHVVQVDSPADDGLPDFLVNDSDPGHPPYTIHSSEGPVLAVTAVTDATVDGPVGPGHLQVQMTATMPAGWAYLRIVNPAAASGYRLTRVVRSDGREVRIGDNAWTTHRIIRLEGQPPTSEDWLHLVDMDGTASYTLTFAPPPIPGDFDVDGDVDDDDLAAFELCATGPAITGPPAGCAPEQFDKADMDDDNDVDQSDFGIWQRCYSGADDPADPNCAD